MESTQFLRSRLLSGLVIPAHPLSLDHQRRLHERTQRALTRYYLASGVGGLAVGVHTTQFEIHDDQTGWLRPVLELAIEEARRIAQRPVMIAGIVGQTAQAVRESQLAVELGYDAGLLSLSSLAGESIDVMIRHAAEVAEVIPIIGFYLQPSVGGCVLPIEFWRRFVEIENVVAIKIAPFNRYQTLDVVRAVAESNRLGEIALYTGNDDNIVVDLLTEFSFAGATIAGGLLGHWAVWTHRAVQLMNEIRAWRDLRDDSGETSDVNSGRTLGQWLTLAAEVTDCNAAFFDAANGFAGCIAGLHEVLFRQGLMLGHATLNPAEGLSPGQACEIDRVYAQYPHLHDDNFVSENRDQWLSG